MAERDPDVAVDEAPPLRARRRLPRPRRWLGGGLLALLALFASALFVLDTDFGHRFIAERVAALPIKSGLRIRIGRIDGSIWGATRLRDLRLYDTKGLFLEVPELRLDWTPAKWLVNRLDIDRLETDLAVFYRKPQLRPTGKQGPILPGFDIRVGRLDIRTLRFGPEVTGQPRAARVTGRADIRKGRALVDLKAFGVGGGDRVALLLDAEPDRDRFDLDAHLEAPANGVIGKLAGTARPMSLEIAGDGSWAKWNGKALLLVSANRVVDLALAVRDGTYSLSGTLAPAPILQGKLQRLSSPRVVVTGSATLADRRLNSRLSLRSGALGLNAAGVLDLGESAFDNFVVGGQLLRPQALFPNMTGTGIRLKTTLNGPFRTATFDYLLTAPRMAFDNTGFEDVRATGRGHFSPSPVSVPIRLSARRVTGVGDVAGGILGHLRVEGLLKVTSKLLTGDRLALDSDKLKGRLNLRVDLVTGVYDVGLTGALAHYLIPGLGLVDVQSELKVMPGVGGRGTRVAGRGRAWVRRFDNAFLRSLAGGLPQIDTGLVRDPDGVLHFINLRLTGPAISITGNGYRRRDGTFHFEGAGTQGTYGPIKLILDGNISRPKLDILLDRPMDALGLRAVRLLLDPTPEGFAYQAAGGSTLGPFASTGTILLPPGQAATISVARLDVTGTRGTGALRSDPGGVTGQLAFTGGGIGGTLLFSPVGTVQRIEGKLTAERATLAGDAGLTVRRGTLDGNLLIRPEGPTVNATIVAQGLRRGGISVARLASNIELAGGRGKVRASIAGSRGRAFDIQTVATIEPDHYALVGQGSIDRQPVRLTTPAVLRREGDGWRLSPTELAFNGGSARVAGLFGGGINQVEATLEAMPLGVLDIFYPELGMGGVASGRFNYRAAGDQMPTGRADLKIKGLTRSGLVLSSQPVDVGVAAVLDARGAVGRAVVASGGRTIGRAQGKIGPLLQGGSLKDRFAHAQLFAQLRYNGPGDTLWRLTGIDTIDLSGPVAIGADVTGLLSDPIIRGSVRTENGRLEGATSGTVIQQIRASGRFDGSRLVLQSMTGTTPGGGSVMGSGVFDLASARGFGMDVAITAKQARLLDRDDIGATVTGPLTIKAQGGGGVIAGDVTVDRGRFRLGQAAAAAAVPRIAVTEVNRPADEAEVEGAPTPWRLDLHAKARNRLAVTGLGLDSEWRADLVIKGQLDNPAITGRADLIRGGYEFAGRRFDLDRGAIRFLGEAPPDPVLDIVASANIQGLNATIRVSGTGQKPDIAFTSVPALPEDELLSRLLFGTSITNLSAPEALQLAAAVASLRGGGTGLNPINAIRRAAGLDRLRILPADMATGARTSIAAGKYIGRRTYVEVITDGQGYSATRAEFQITRWLSILSSISTLGRSSLNVRVSKDY